MPVTIVPGLPPEDPHFSHTLPLTAGEACTTVEAENNHLFVAGVVALPAARVLPVRGLRSAFIRSPRVNLAHSPFRCRLHSRSVERTIFFLRES